jgi:hypothetical protein
MNSPEATAVQMGKVGNRGTWFFTQQAKARRVVFVKAKSGYVMEPNQFTLRARPLARICLQPAPEIDNGHAFAKAPTGCREKSHR